MKKILVIEDNKDNMALVEEILEDEGFKTVKAFTAEIGIAHLKKHKIDLILMDISLPQMTGLEATRIIKSNPQTCEIPIIALTAHAMQRNQKEAFSAGCDDFMTKPIDEEKLILAIQEQLK